MMAVTPVDQETSKLKKRKMERPRKSLQQVEIVDLESDLFSFTDKGTTKKNAISVEQYCEQRDLQFPIKASTKTTISDSNYVDLDNYDDDLILLTFKPPNTPFRKSRTKTKKPFSGNSTTEPGESSNSKASKDPPFICEICIEPKQADESFNIKGCSHAYCTDCVIKYVASKLQDKITAITCPVANCEGLLEPEYCYNILPREVFERWGDALCEAMVLGFESLYCPFKDCSVLLIVDGGQAVKESECPNCRRLFCAQCKVPWHPEIDCREFQRLHKDERQREDIMLLMLARDNKWARCPRCRIVVERTEGCRYMRCRCGTAFCYSCGSTQVNSYHYCNKCKG